MNIAGNVISLLFKLLPRFFIVFFPSDWVKVAQSCPAVCDSMDYTVHGILQARILEWPFPSPGDLPNPEIKPRFLALQADCLPIKPQGKPIPSKEQVFFFFNFMAAVTIHSDFGAQEKKICHCFYFFPFYLSWSDGTRCHDLSFFNAEF